MRLPAWSLAVVLLVGVASTRAETGVGPGGREPGPWADSRGEKLDRVAREIVAWWAASRDALRFDGVSGRWRIERS